jgi:hypothetical protein
MDRSPQMLKNRLPAYDSQRTLVRKRQRLMDGFLASDRMLTPRPCTICDMNPLGGKVELWNGDIKSSLLGDRVTLYITGDKKEVDCKVMWRKENSMGLRFTSGFHPPTRRYS